MNPKTPPPANMTKLLYLCYQLRFSKISADETKRLANSDITASERRKAPRQIKQNCLFVLYKIITVLRGNKKGRWDRKQKIQQYQLYPSP